MLKYGILDSLFKIFPRLDRIQFFVPFTYNYLAVAIENQKRRASRKVSCPCAIELKDDKNEQYFSA